VLKETSDNNSVQLFYFINVERMQKRNQNHIKGPQCHISSIRISVYNIGIVFHIAIYMILVGIFVILAVLLEYIYTYTGCAI
jgi:hypothetical protein